MEFASDIAVLEDESVSPFDKWETIRWADPCSHMKPATPLHFSTSTQGQQIIQRQAGSTRMEKFPPGGRSQRHWNMTLSPDVGGRGNWCCFHPLTMRLCHAHPYDHVDGSHRRLEHVDKETLSSTNCTAALMKLFDHEQSLVKHAALELSSKAWQSRSNQALVRALMKVCAPRATRPCSGLSVKYLGFVLCGFVSMKVCAPLNEGLCSKVCAPKIA